MDDRLLRVESAVRDLEQSIGHIEHRLAAIERAVVETGAGGNELALVGVPHRYMRSARALGPVDAFRATSSRSGR